MKMNLRMMRALAMSLFVVSLQAMETSSKGIFPLVDLPLDLQRAIICAHSLGVTSITDANADALKEEVKSFFLFQKTCTYFNKMFKFPWSQLSLEQKNKLMEDANLFIKNLIYEEFKADQRIKEKKWFRRTDEDISYKTWFDRQAHDYIEELYLPEFRKKVVAGYKEYCIIPLMIVHCGAHPDTLDPRSSTCLSKAVHAGDELGAALLLKHGANPLQMTYCEDYIAAVVLLEHAYDKNIEMPPIYDDPCLLQHELIFRAQTMSMLHLLLEHVDSQMLLKLHVQLISVLKPHFDPEVFKYWAEMSLKTEHWFCDNNDRIPSLVKAWLLGYQLKVDDIENQLAKIQIALDILLRDC